MRPTIPYSTVPGGSGFFLPSRTPIPPVPDLAGERVSDHVVPATVGRRGLRRFRELTHGGSESIERHELAAGWLAFDDEIGAARLHGLERHEADEEAIGANEHEDTVRGRAPERRQARKYRDELGRGVGDRDRARRLRSSPSAVVVDGSRLRARRRAHDESYHPTSSRRPHGSILPFQ